MGMHVTVHGKNETPVNGQEGSWVPVKVNANGQLSIALLNGELTQFNRLAGGAIASYTSLTADGVIANAPCLLYGYIVNVATSAAVINVYDNASAGSGTIVYTIPASSAVGEYIFPVGIMTTAGAYADFVGTGTVNFLYAPSV